MSDIIKEATQSVETIQAALENAKRVYQYRSEEMKDEDIWGQMSKGLKKQYLQILKDKENEITKLERRLERAKAGQLEDPESTEDSLPGGIADNMSIEDLAKKHNVSVEHIQAQIEMGTVEEMEHTNDPLVARDIILDHLFDDPNYYSEGAIKEGFDIVRDTLSPPKEVDIETEVIADEILDQFKLDKITLRRGLENIINLVEDLLVNKIIESVNIKEALEEILRKFKEVKGSVEGENDIDTGEVKIVKLAEEDVNSDSNIDEPIAPNETDPKGTQEYLKGNLEEREGEEPLQFEDDEITDIIESNWYIWGGHEGSFTLEVNNTTEYKNDTYQRYKIKVDYVEPEFLDVEAEIDDQASQQLCKEIKGEILYQVKLREKPGKTIP